MKAIIFLFACSLLMTQCTYQKDCCGVPAGNEVEFYLLKSYNAEPFGHFMINNPVIEADPFIRFDEIREYDADNYIFTLKKSAIDKIKPINEPRAFAVTVDRRVVYAGFFRQSFLSSSCDCIRIDPQSALLNDNKILVELGYAPTRDLSDIDARNDEQLLATLRRAGKLK